MIFLIRILFLAICIFFFTFLVNAKELRNVNLKINLNPTSEFHKEIGAETILPTGKLKIVDVAAEKIVYYADIANQVESVSATISGSPITGLEDELKNTSKVFPSPGNNQRIIIPADNVQIYSVTGKLEKSINISTSSTQGYSQFDFNGLKDGLHIMKYVTSDGKVHSTKFVSRQDAPSAQKSLEEIAGQPIINNFNISNGRTKKVSEDITLFEVSYIPQTAADEKLFYPVDSVFEVTET